MKYLVLGSSGQIGRELCIFLEKNNQEVVKFDIYDNPKQDLRKEDALYGYIEICDFIFFLAFDVGGSKYLQRYQNTFEFINNNVEIIHNTFNVIKKFNKPFIFASSQMSNMSYSPYGICKSLGEIYTKSLNGLIVKFWNVYGYESDLEKSHVITDFILMAKNGEIRTLTNGEEERQFLHAEDCSNALMILSNNYNTISRDKNLHITSFKWDKIKNIANIIQKKIDCNIVLSENIDNVQLNKKNEPDTHILKYWKPKIGLEDGINKIIEQMK